MNKQVILDRYQQVRVSLFRQNRLGKEINITIRNLTPHSKAHIQRSNFSRNFSRNLSLSTALAASLAGCPPKPYTYITPTPIASPFITLSPTPKLTPTPAPSPIPTLSSTPKTTYTHAPSPYVTLTPTPIITPTPKPTPMWPEAINFKWEEISPPASTSVINIIYYGNSLFALNQNELYKSSDNGSSWTVLPTLSMGKDYNGNIGFYDMDIDQDKIWICGSNGIIVSDNLDGNFSWSFHWEWDGATSVDFEKGYGWAIVPKWGSMSGIIKYAPGEGWKNVGGNYSWDGDGAIKTDPFDPDNTAFFGYYLLTLDGGSHWEANHIDFASILNNKSIFFSGSKYSQDRGITWEPLGIDASVFTKAGEIFYAVGFDQANRDYDSIYSGTPNNWTRLGLAAPQGFNIAATDSTVFAKTLDEKLYRGTRQK